MLEFQLVVPAYNEAKSLPHLIKRVAEAAKNFGYNAKQFQLVVVENGSKDNSSIVLTELKRTELGEWFHIVPVKENKGYGFGVLSGLHATQAPIVGFSHADLQCDPQDAFKALEHVKQSTQAILVKGVRSGRNWKDRFVTKVFEYFALIFLGLRVSEINAQPKVFKRELLDNLQTPPYTFAFDLYVLYHAAKAKYKIQTIQVLFPPRIHGFSNWASTFLGRYKTIMAMIVYMWKLSRHEGRIS